MDRVLHLHLGHHELDVVLLVGQVGNDAFISVADFGDMILNELDLILGLVFAAGDVLVKGLHDFTHLLDTGDDVFVVARHEAFHSVCHALCEGVLIADASGEGVEVVLT